MLGPDPRMGNRLFEVYCSADYGGNKDSGKSTTGWPVKMGIGAVTWSSKAQDTIVISTTETEYIAAVFAGKEILGLSCMLTVKRSSRLSVNRACASEQMTCQLTGFPAGSGRNCDGSGGAQQAGDEQLDFVTEFAGQVSTTLDNAFICTSSNHDHWNEGPLLK